MFRLLPAGSAAPAALHAGLARARASAVRLSPRSWLAIGGGLAIGALVALPSAVGIALALLLAAGGGGAAAASAAQRRHQDAQAAAAEAARAAESLEGIGWREFELLISESFRQRGYRVLDLVGSDTEHRFDLVLVRQGRITLAHCRPVGSDRVDDDAIRALAARRRVRGASSAILVSAGRFTSRSVACAKDHQVSLLGGRPLRKLIHEVRASRRGASLRADAEAARAPPAAGSR